MSNKDKHNIMATIIEELKALSAYPIPTRTLVSIAEGRGLFPHDVLTEDVRTAFRKAATEWYNAKYNDTPEAQHDVADKWAKVMEAKRLFDEAMRDLSALEASETGEE
jgi:hypothetical protein